MFENIDIHSSVPVYEQIENHVQFGIASAQLKPGDRLPTVRELSERLGVNPNTIAKSYRDLEVMGLLTARRGMGVFVRRDIEESCRENCRRRIISRLHEAVQEAKAAGMLPKEVKEVVDKSFTLESHVYGELPEALKGLIKTPTPKPSKSSS
ncbi:MAG: GntR family transcriptional regulator [Candidatus Hydrogenedentes bacterium]|nr:GntR family transcriptional regulator [Candidatus Hydrogenedentota bacterium]